MDTSSPIKRIAFCPHCGNRAPQRLVYMQQFDERVWLTSTGQEDAHPAAYFVAVCETCSEVLIYQAYMAFEETDFREAKLVWPKVALDVSVPEGVARIYEEAARIKAIAPNAFAVQIRRALEALCKDRGAKAGALARQLQELSDRGEIPKTLPEASEVLRLIGNVGAHASDTDVHPLQAAAIDSFFKAIVEYVYVSPRRIYEFKERIGKYNKTKGLTNEGGT